MDAHLPSVHDWRNAILQYIRGEPHPSLQDMFRALYLDAVEQHRRLTLMLQAHVAEYAREKYVSGQGLVAMYSNKFKPHIRSYDKDAVGIVARWKTLLDYTTTQVAGEVRMLLWYNKNALLREPRRPHEHMYAEAYVSPGQVGPVGDDVVCGVPLFSVQSTLRRLQQ